MKKIICLFISMFISVVSCSQRIISMEKEGGVYKIPCTVNGARMKMIFDTGASSISISMSIANFLYENEYIVKDDILGKGQTLTASGDIVDHIVINLRDVEIGGVHLKNVQATVIDGQDAPLLLGQTAIQALGSITINGDKLIINDAPKTTLTQKEVVDLRKEASSSADYESYFVAIDCLKKIEAANMMTLEDRDLLSFCYYKTFDYENCINSCKNFLGTQNLNTDDNYGLVTNAYYLLGQCYYEKEQYSQAVFWYEKHLARKVNGSRDIDFRDLMLKSAIAYGEVGNVKKCKSFFNVVFMQDLRENGLSYSAEEASSITSKQFKGKEFVKRLSEDLEIYGSLCARKIIDEVPSSYFSIALRSICDYLGYDYNKVLNKKQRGTNYELGHKLYLRGLYADNASDAESYIRLAKEWGDKDAIDFIKGYEENMWK